jgi:15-hydroxyprostaglandin dehydrogenase (NAD)
LQGGAGGLGVAFAEVILRRGGSVALLDVQGGETASRRLGEVFGRSRLLAVHCDVTSEESLRSALDAARSHFERLDVVINNAGIATSLFHDMSKAVAVNLLAVMRGTELAAAMDGVQLVVNIASVAGLGPVATTPVYAATKAGVVNFTRSLRWLKAQRGVRVVCICPSWTATPMVQSVLDQGLRAVIDSTPFGIMEPAQVGQALVLALDDESLAGDVIVVTGDKGVRVMRYAKSDSGPTTARL